MLADYQEFKREQRLALIEKTRLLEQSAQRLTLSNPNSNPNPTEHDHDDTDYFGDEFMKQYRDRRIHEISQAVESQKRFGQLRLIII